MSQSDLPAHSLDDALRIPVAIAEQYGGQPATPVEVGVAIGVSPTTGHFRMLAGAAMAYGLIDGGAYADQMSLTEIGRRITRPLVEGDDVAARREAFLRPRIPREFLSKYDGSPLPVPQVAHNVLEKLGVPRDRAEQAMNQIIDGAESLGLLADINGKKFPQLKASLQSSPAIPTVTTADTDDADAEVAVLPGVAPASGPPTPPAPSPAVSSPEPSRNRRVFISHGSNKKIVDQVKELLTFGDFEPVVSVESETTAKPVPTKVLDEMRSCGAGTIHVGREKTIVDADGTEHHLLNDNVLIEIGAALALWGDNFVLLVEEGVTLPSNLQGLYEARYVGDELDHNATMKLLRTFKQFKS